MKKPFIISIEKIKDTVRLYKQSPEYIEKINRVKLGFQRDKFWLDEMVNELHKK